MITPRRPRVFLGLTEIAGYYATLKSGLEELGVPATFINLTDHPFQYAADAPNRLTRLTKRVRQRRLATSPRERLRRLAWTLLEGTLRSALFVWALASFDVFVFAYGATFLSWPAFELRLLKLWGRRIVSVHHGSDSRPPYLDGSLMARDQGRTIGDCIELIRMTKARVAQFDRFADWVVDNPLAAHLHERLCVKWFALGVPYRTPNVELGPPARADGEVRIIHSPSHPESKGTPRIRAAIEALRAKGHRIDFVEIAGRPHAEVLRELAACDFVVDQVYSDSPMAGFATEAAHFGKPAVVGGYGLPAFREWISPEAMPPAAYCHPDDLEASIERLIVDPGFRRRMGQAAMVFVRSQWSPRQVASRYLRLFVGDVPSDWLFDPRNVRYVHGYGLPEERARELIRAVSEQGGVGALQLPDKPELEQRLMEFASANQTREGIGCSSVS